MNCMLCGDPVNIGVCLGCAEMGPAGEGATAEEPRRPPEMSVGLRERFKALFEDYLEDVKMCAPELAFYQLSVAVRPGNESYFAVSTMEVPR